MNNEHQQNKHLSANYFGVLQQQCWKFFSDVSLKYFQP